MAPFIFCWICQQKAEYKKEKIILARQSAFKKATDEKKTIVIWCEGPNYRVGTEDECGSHEVIEYISGHTQITTT